MAHNQLSWNVLLISWNLIGQLCLSGLGYGSRSVSYDLFFEFPRWLLMRALTVCSFIVTNLTVDQALRIIYEEDN